jgi:hypothetical protein
MTSEGIEMHLRACARALNAGRVLIERGYPHETIEEMLRVARWRLARAEEQLPTLNRNKHFVLFEAAPVIRQRLEAFASEFGSSNHGRASAGTTSATTPSGNGTTAAAKHSPQVPPAARE